MKESEASEISNHGDVIGVSYHLTALYNALLFDAPQIYIKKVADAVYRHKNGWSGIIGHFNYLMVLSFYILAHNVEDDATLKEAHAAFSAFPSSKFKHLVAP